MKKFSFNHLIAITSILVWATAWIATEKKADAQTPPVAFSHVGVAALK